jgi:hypothetical protein
MVFDILTAILATPPWAFVKLTAIRATLLWVLDKAPPVILAVAVWVFDEITETLATLDCVFANVFDMRDMPVVGFDIV